MGRFGGLRVLCVFDVESKMTYEPRDPSKVPDHLKPVEVWYPSQVRVPKDFHSWKWWEKLWADFFEETPPWRKGKA